MPTLQLAVNLTIKRPFFQKMAERVRDFLPAWDRIVSAFTEHNVDKFQQAKGKEMTGVRFDEAGVYWDPITEEYAKRKRQMGGPGSEDWRMVQSGETMESLIDRDNPDWFERLEPLSAIFGSVHDLVLIHWDRSPVTFLDAADKESIQYEFYSYLSGLDPYEPYPITERTHRAVSKVQVE